MGLVLSMRTKVVLGGLCFFLVLAVLAYPGVPHVAEAIRGMAQGMPLVENESQPPEQDAPPEQEASLEQDRSSSAQEEGPATQVDLQASFTPFLEGDRMVLFRDDFVGGWYPWNHPDLIDNVVWPWATVDVVDRNTEWGSESSYRASAEVTYDAYLFLNIEKEPEGSWRDCILYSRKEYCPPVVLEVRLRCSDDNKLMSEKGVGRKLWGWGYKERGVWDFGPCFISISPESELPLPGLWVGHFDRPEQWIPIRDIDITEWHTYTIVIEDNVPNRDMEYDTTFLVDGEVVASASILIPRRTSKLLELAWRPTEMYVTVGLDNAFYQVDNQGRPRRGEDPVNPFDQWIQIDYVDIYMDKESFDAIEEMNRVKREEFDEVPLISSLAQELITERNKQLRSLKLGSMDFWDDPGLRLVEGWMAEAQNVWLETQDLWEKIFWGEDLEYNRNAYQSAAGKLDEIVGRLEGMLAECVEIEALFVGADTVISDAKQGSDDEAISLLESWKAEARRHWRSLDVNNTRMFLEAILDTSRWQKIASGFRDASAAIIEAEEMGTHPSILAGMKTNYRYAANALTRNDLERAEQLLDYVLHIAKQYFETEISEPGFLFTLGLILLPALLRRRGIR